MNTASRHSRPPYGKIRYKATYRDPKRNPFARILTVPTKTVDIDASVPIEQVEQWAREACEGYEFVSVAAVKR